MTINRNLVPCVTEDNRFIFVPDFARTHILPSNHEIQTAPIAGVGADVDFIGLCLPGFIIKGVKTEDMDFIEIDTAYLDAFYFKTKLGTAKLRVPTLAMSAMKLGNRLIFQNTIAFKLSEMIEANGVLDDAQIKGIELHGQLSYSLNLNTDTGHLTRTMRVHEGSIVLGYTENSLGEYSPADLVRAVEQATLGFTLQATRMVELASELNPETEVTRTPYQLTEIDDHKKSEVEMFRPVLTEDDRHLFFVQNDCPVRVFSAGEKSLDFAPLRLPFNGDLLQLHMNARTKVPYNPGARLSEDIRISQIYVNLDRRTTVHDVVNREGSKFVASEMLGENYYSIDKVYVLHLEPVSKEPGRAEIHGTLVIRVFGQVQPAEGTACIRVKLDLDETKLFDSESEMTRENVAGFWLTSSVGIELAASVLDA